MNESRASSEVELKRAREQFSAGQFDLAVDRINSVASAFADQPGVLLDCVRHFALCYEIERAEALLESILEVAPVETKATIGLIFQQIYRPERAVTVLEQLQATNGLTLPQLAQLAKLYEQSNRKEAAVAALTQCVEQAPSQPQPKVLLARSIPSARRSEPGRKSAGAGCGDARRPYCHDGSRVVRIGSGQ